MTAPRNESPASLNLIQTYMALGMATKNAVCSAETAFDLCLGELDHPICNFAANLDLDPWSARRLFEIASTKQHFNVYASPGDRPAHLNELLLRAGFVSTYRLVQLVADPVGIAELDSSVSCELDERPEVARFMVDQFFSRRSPEFRAAVMGATLNSEGTQLYSVRDRSKRFAAVMLSERAGILGCYNLCVAPAFRGRGLGTSIVRWVLGQARRRGLMATVQCEPQLETWYRALGFERTGWLNVYRLPEDRTSVIMEAV